MNNIREHIYLSAMLHDIGKFYQRADTGSVATSEYLKAYCKDESSFCPLFKGMYTHKHVLWTAQFIDDFNAVFSKLVSNGLNNLSEKDNLMNLAAGHHLSAEQLTELGRIVKEADCLSSGMDRDSDIALRDDADELTHWDSFKRKRLIPITDTISKSKEQLEHLGKWQLRLCPISLTTQNFPNDKKDEGKTYKELWQSFVGEFKFIQANTYKAFSETLLSVLYKYTSCIPASTVNFPDVSLYDHLKTTAALAVCLYDVYKSGEKPKDPFLLIGADLSGIQPYIYQVVSKYAGKNLKGRSFYLRILTDVVVHYLLESMELFSANVIYNSGGGFYILAPNTCATRDRLQKAIGIIEKQMFDVHGNCIFLAIDCIELSRETLMHKRGKSLSTAWGQLFEKKKKKKNARYLDLLKTDYDQFFMPFMKGGDEKVDLVTGEYFIKGEKHESEGDLKPIRKITKDQIILGRTLKDFDSMVVSDGEISYWKDKPHIQLLQLGVYYYFIKNDDLEKMKAQLRASADKVTVVTLNGKNEECKFLGMLEGINNAYRLEFYGGNGVSRKYNSTFEEMCERMSDDAFHRMGVLRMDVDNLGHIFQQGISPERSTLSRLSALSRSFDYFFSGYLNTIWQEVAPERSFIIYSGGDDLFIVGSWETTIQLAERIHEEFKIFTCSNPAFSISGGIAFVKDKFPIIKGSEMSADEESRAKKHTCNGKKKNAISFLGMALNFDEEYPQVKDLKGQIVSLCLNEQLPRSFIQKVLQHKETSKMNNHSIENVKTYWMLTYDLSRMKQRLLSIDAKNIIENCKAEVCVRKATLNGKDINSLYHPLELWALACRWAELEIRSQEQIL